MGVYGVVREEKVHFVFLIDSLLRPSCTLKEGRLFISLGFVAYYVAFNHAEFSSSRKENGEKNDNECRSHERMTLTRGGSSKSDID